MRAGWKVTVCCEAFFWGKEKDKNKKNSMCIWKGTFPCISDSALPTDTFQKNQKEISLQGFLLHKKFMFFQKLPWLGNMQERLHSSPLSIMQESTVGFYTFDYLMPSWLMFEPPIPRGMYQCTYRESYHRTHALACRDWSPLTKWHIVWWQTKFFTSSVTFFFPKAF